MHLGVTGLESRCWKMHEEIIFRRGAASLQQVAAHLAACDAQFIPPLSSRVEISGYAAKIIANAERFEAWTGEELVGLAALYCNQAHAFLTSLSVLPAWQHRGIASALLAQAIDHARGTNMTSVELEVSRKNKAAFALYQNHGFAIKSEAEDIATLALLLATKE